MERIKYKTGDIVKVLITQYNWHNDIVSAYDVFAKVTYIEPYCDGYRMTVKWTTSVKGNLRRHSRTMTFKNDWTPAFKSKEFNGFVKGSVGVYETYNQLKNVILV